MVGSKYKAIGNVICSVLIFLATAGLCFGQNGKIENIAEQAKRYPEMVFNNVLHLADARR